MNHLFYCHNCGKQFEKNIQDKELKTLEVVRGKKGISCIFCHKLQAENIKILARLGIVTGKCFTPVAIMEDKNGKQFEVNNKGKVISSSSTKYDNDPRGWKRKGKKAIRRTDQHGKINNR